MKVLPPIPSCLAAHMTFRSAVPIGGVRFYLRYTTAPPNDGQCVQLADHIQAAWQDHLAVHTTADKTLESTKVWDLSDVAGGVGFSTASHPGTNPGVALPNDVCVLINHHVRRKYRGGKPRTYLIAGDVGQTLNGNTWAPAFVTQMNTDWAAFMNQVKLGVPNLTIDAHVNIPYYKGFHVVTHPETGRAQNVPDLNPNPVPDVISSSTARSIIGSQRRRLTAG